MQIFIMRHGQANLTADVDAQRPLTAQGELEAELMASWLQKMNVSPTAIWSSPYVRAQQTTAKVTEKLNDKTRLKTIDFITPSDSAIAVRDYIDGVMATDKLAQLLIISHMPLVSYLVAELTQQQDAPIFQTASIAEIEYDEITMKGRLVRLISPIDLC